MAAKFVEMAEIFGINAFSEDILRDSSQVAMVKNRGQILFVWMDEKGCPLCHRFLVMSDVLIKR